MQRLWTVLTDFEAHPAVMPNVDTCEVLPNKGRSTVQLYQKVFSQTVFWRVEASAVLEVELHDSQDSSQGKALHFQMVSGDFADLSGRWVVHADPDDPQNASTLQYEIVFTPEKSANIPNALAVFLLKQALPTNISALAEQAEREPQVCCTQSPLCAVFLCISPEVSS
jgi:Polyketide cyclase / dehydrase and lipid transport